MTEVLIPRFMAQEPLLASFFADTSRDTFHLAPTLLVPPAQKTSSVVHCDVIAVAPLSPLSTKPTPSRSRKRKASDPKRESTPVTPPGDHLNEQERHLRMAEATILFPKYMACQNSKRVKLNADSKRSKAPLLTYLPTSEYTTKWETYYQCPPSMDTKSQSKVCKFFESDCRVPGSAVTRNATAERELNPLYYDQEWNQRINPIRPGFIDPPEKGSLDGLPNLSGKRVQNPEDRVKMDSFVVALQREMGSEYIDVKTARYFPRSDGRAHLFPDEKGRRSVRMKNGGLDVDVCLRNREIDRAVGLVRFWYHNHGLQWAEEDEEGWDQEMVRYVNPRTVCPGRTFFSEKYVADDERYSPPELLNGTVYAPPKGTVAEELGMKFYWSERAGRMVSVEELRVQQQENMKVDAKYEAAMPVEESNGRRSKSRSPSRRSRENSQ